MTRPRQTDTPYLRKRLLQLLQDADGEWLIVDDIKTVPYPRVNITRLLKLGLVETILLRDELNVRITIDGRRALAEGNVTFRSTKKSWSVPRDVIDSADKLAEELGLRQEGKGGAVRGGAVAVLRAVMGRREAFKRWYKHISVED